MPQEAKFGSEMDADSDDELSFKDEDQLMSFNDFQSLRTRCTTAPQSVLKLNLKIANPMLNLKLNLRAKKRYEMHLPRGYVDCRLSLFL